MEFSRFYGSGTATVSLVTIKTVTPDITIHGWKQ
jgi:hypothetical protein